MKEEEFEDIFGNVPFENIKKIQKYIEDNYVSLDLYIIEKEKNRQNKMRIVQLENEITARIEDLNNYYISKDKIREKIEEYRKQVKEYEKQEESFPFSGFWHNELLKATHKINVLQELLEED